MRKYQIVGIIFSLLLAALFAACGGSPKPAASEAPVEKPAEQAATPPAAQVTAPPPVPPEPAPAPAVKPPAEPAAPPPPPDPLEALKALVSSGKDTEAMSLYVTFPDVDLADPAGRTALHIAALNKNARLAEFFLRQGADVNARDDTMTSPLGISVFLNDGATASVLCVRGADIHSGFQGGGSPIAKAVGEGNAPMILSMLNVANIQSAGSGGQTALHLASQAVNITSVMAVLQAAQSGGGSVSGVNAIINRRDANDDTALDIVFAQKNQIAAAEIAQVLIQMGSVSRNDFYTYFAPAVRSMNFNLLAQDGNASLHFAAYNGYRGYVEYLLTKPVDIDIKNSSGRTPVHEAVRGGEVEILDLLLRSHAKPDIQDGLGNAPLHVSAPADRHAAVVSRLLFSGANPNLRNGRGDTALHVMVRENISTGVLEVLLNGRAGVDVQNGEGRTPLFLAVEGRRLATIQLLISAGANIFVPDKNNTSSFERALLDSSQDILRAMITNATVRQTDLQANTALIIAVRNRAATEIVRMILDNSQDRTANVNMRNKEGDSALHYAVRQNQEEVGTILVDSDTDIFAINSNGESPLSLTFSSAGGTRVWMLSKTVTQKRDSRGNNILHYAALWQLDREIPLIVERGAATEETNVSGDTPLFVAVRQDSPGTVRAMLASGALVDGRDPLGNSGLHAGVRYDALNAVRTLLDGGADINAYNLSGKTPMHSAVSEDRFDIETLFVSRGANLEIRDKQGNTPLMEAINTGTFRSASFLLESGADCATRNNEGQTPLLVAVNEERSDLVSLFLKFGAPIHAQDFLGNSPFTNALARSDRMIYTLLTPERARNPDDEGRSPLHIAITKGMAPGKLDIIVRLGGRLTTVDREGKTPLRLAVDMQNWEAVKFLTDAGSDIYSVARDGRSPAEYVLASGNADALAAMFGSGKAVKLRDPSGNTVLHYAARDRGPEEISALLSYGAEKAARNTAREIPLDIASRWSNAGAVAVLK